MNFIRKTGLLVATTIICVGYINLFLGTLCVSIVIAPIEYFLTESIEFTCDWFDYIQNL